MAFIVRDTTLGMPVLFDTFRLSEAHPVQDDNYTFVNNKTGDAYRISGKALAAAGDSIDADWLMLYGECIPYTGEKK